MENTAQKTEMKNPTGESNKCPTCGTPYEEIIVSGVTIQMDVCGCRAAELNREEQEKAERSRRREIEARQTELNTITNTEFLRGDDGLVTIDTLRRKESNQKQIEFIETYIARITELVNGGRSMGLIGDPGTGKTALMISIHKEIVNAGYASALVNVSMLFPKLDHLVKESRSTWTVIDTLSKADALFLDDIFRYEYTRSKREILYRILEYRYPLKLPVFFASNKYGKDMADTRAILIDIIGGNEVGEAIIDRLLCTGESARANEKGELPRVTILTLTGKSWR